MPKSTSDYLQDMKEPPEGYHVARWHPNGKLYIGQGFEIEENAEQYVINRNELLADLGLVGLLSRYFVWHASLAAEDLEAHKVSEPR
jgi:hypothetical protein